MENSEFDRRCAELMGWEWMESRGIILKGDNLAVAITNWNPSTSLDDMRIVELKVIKKRAEEYAEALTKKLFKGDPTALKRYSSLAETSFTDFKNAAKFATASLEQRKAAIIKVMEWE